MKILVSNVGSTSFKYKLFDMDGEFIVASGGAERVNSPQGVFTYLAPGKPLVILELPLVDHNAAIKLMLNKLVDPEVGVIRDLGEISAIGFKTVFAGDVPETVTIDDKIMAGLEQYSSILPAHNPPYIAAIRVFQKLTPGTPLVGVFESGFHRGRAEYTRVYGVPYRWYSDMGIQKHGYHGTSHRYVSERVCKFLGCSPMGLKIINCHLGGSSSICAIKDGKSVDTSMGFSAQSGIISSTRNGDLDPFVLIYLMQNKHMSIREISEMLYQQSGLFGISGVSGDIRDLEIAADEGNEHARLALQVMVYDVKRYIGAYTAILEGFNLLTFSGGIGEKSYLMRSRICQGLEFLGIEIDYEHNRQAVGKEMVISTAKSKVKVVVIPTNEEIIVARHTAGLIKSLANS